MRRGREVTQVIYGWPIRLYSAESLLYATNHSPGLIFELFNGAFAQQRPSWIRRRWLTRQCWQRYVNEWRHYTLGRQVYTCQSASLVGSDGTAESQRERHSHQLQSQHHAHTVDIIGAMLIGWGLRGKIIRSVLRSIVMCNNCAQCSAHTVWTDLTVLWIVFCLAGLISQCLDLFLYMYYFVCILHACVRLRPAS